MPYRKRLQSSTTESPQKLLGVWREERSLRVGKALGYSGVVLTAIATVADFFWSDPSVILTDFILLLGCLISLYWLLSPRRPSYYWLPLLGGYWISLIPSYWTTGGLNSPFFGIGLAGLYVIGVVMDPRDRSLFYLIFSFLHLPAFYYLEKLYPLDNTQLVPSQLSLVVNGATLAAIYVCVHFILKTERQLSQEFSEHYHDLYKAEAELKLSAAQLKEAQSIGGIGSWEWDILADRVYWSDELFNIFQVKKENFDPTFKGYLARLNPEMKKNIENIVNHSVSTGSNYVFENKIEANGQTKYILSRGRVIKDTDGNVIKLFGTCQDTTELKLIESQLLAARTELEKRVEKRTLQLAKSLERERAAKEIAENASQAKMQFLANMSHEIRTPLNSILGFAELLASEEMAPTSQDYITRIRKNGKQLLHLINDILDLSKFEAGQIPIQKTPVNLKALVDEIVLSFLPVLNSKGLSLKISFQGDLWPRILTDAHRLSQVLTNLLNNAIKFSDKGDIRLTVLSKKISDRDLSLTFDIEDSGVGISIEGQKNLFQPFSQGDSSVARKFGGSGLGLALSKRIIEALDGTLELKKSTLGQGSHFSFNFLAEMVSDLAVPSTPNLVGHEALQKFVNKRILLVEDAPDNATLVSHYIESLGAHIDLATDGLQAVQKVKEGNYDCILMDIQMPGMDGLEATRRIRSFGFKKPIIALTAHALPGESTKSLQAGCNLHLTKPITKTKLINALSDYIKS